MIIDKYKKKLDRIENLIDSNIKAGITNTNKLKTQRRILRNSIANLERNTDEIIKLKPRTYYSVEVMLSSCNMAHKSIMYIGHDVEEYPIKIFNKSYVKDMFIDNIYSFKVLRELEEMK